MYICIHTCIYICIYIHINIYIYIYIYIYVYVYICIYMYIYTYSYVSKYLVSLCLSSPSNVGVFLRLITYRSVTFLACERKKSVKSSSSGKWFVHWNSFSDNRIQRWTHRADGRTWRKTKKTTMVRSRYLFCFGMVRCRHVCFWGRKALSCSGLFCLV